MRNFILIGLLTVLLIVGCAKASDPTDTTKGVLREVTRVPLNGDGISIDISDSYIAVAEFDAGISLIDRNTFDRTWYTEIVGMDDNSVLNLARNRVINLVEDLGFLLFTEEQDADNYRIVDLTQTDTLKIVSSILGGTFAIRQLELYQYTDPNPTEFENFTARGFYVNDNKVTEVGWNSAINLIQGFGDQSGWSYPVRRIYGADMTDNYVFAAAGQRGVFISDRQNYNILTEFGTPGEALNLKIKDNYLYVACRQSGIRVYNISDIYNVKEVYSYDTTGYAQNLDVNDNYAVLASGGGNLYLYNVSDPENIRFVERQTSTGYTNSVKIDKDNRVYVGTRDDGEVIFDINR